MTVGLQSVRSGHPTKGVHPEPAEGLFSSHELSANGCRLMAGFPTSFLSPISNFRASSFQALPHSFIFRIHLNPRHSYNFRTLARKTGGYTPTRSYHGSPLSAVDCRLSAVIVPLSPFTTFLTQKQGGTWCWSYHGRGLLSVTHHQLPVTSSAILWSGHSANSHRKVPSP